MPCLAAAPQPQRGDCKRIAEAAKEPDAQPDYRVVHHVVERRRRRIVCRRRKVRHHERNSLETGVEYLVEARKLYMRGDDGYVRPLGRGIHYVQDYIVSRYRLLFDKRDHDEMGALLSKARLEEIGAEVFPEAPISRRLYRLLKRPPYQRGGEDAPRGIQGNGLSAVCFLHAIGACLRKLWAKGAYPLARQQSCCGVRHSGHRGSSPAWLQRR